MRPMKTDGDLTVHIAVQVLFNVIPRAKVYLLHDLLKTVKNHYLPPY